MSPYESIETGFNVLFWVAAVLILRCLAKFRKKIGPNRTAWAIFVTFIWLCFKFWGEFIVITNLQQPRDTSLWPFSLVSDSVVTGAGHGLLTPFQALKIWQTLAACIDLVYIGVGLWLFLFWTSEQSTSSQLDDD